MKEPKQMMTKGRQDTNVETELRGACRAWIARPVSRRGKDGEVVMHNFEARKRVPERTKLLACMRRINGAGRLVQSTRQRAGSTGVCAVQGTSGRTLAMRACFAPRRLKGSTREHGVRISTNLATRVILALALWQHKCARAFEQGVSSARANDIGGEATKVKA